MESAGFPWSFFGVTCSGSKTKSAFFREHSSFPITAFRRVFAPKMASSSHSPATEAPPSPTRSTNELVEENEKLSRRVDQLKHEKADLMIRLEEEEE